MDTVVKVIMVMLALIALYLLLVYSGGTTSVLGALANTTVNETKALQGR